MVWLVVHIPPRLTSHGIATLCFFHLFLLFSSIAFTVLDIVIVTIRFLIPCVFVTIPYFSLPPLRMWLVLSHCLLLLHALLICACACDPCLAYVGCRVAHTADSFVRVLSLDGASSIAAGYTIHPLWYVRIVVELRCVQCSLRHRPLYVFVFCTCVHLCCTVLLPINATPNHSLNPVAYYIVLFS